MATGTYKNLSQVEHKTYQPRLKGDISEIEITCMWPGRGGNEFLGKLADVGVDRVVVPLMGAANPIERIQKLAEEVIVA